MRQRNTHRPAFSMVELLVVISVLALLMAILLPSLFSVKAATVRMGSMNTLKQIGEYFTLYTEEYRGTILPSKFNYIDDVFPGKIRQNNGHQGVWSDILWTLYVKNPFGTSQDPAGSYEFDSPDGDVFDRVPTFDQHPFRSGALNTKGKENGLPGFFAANDFFNADFYDDDDAWTYNGWWTLPQIRRPDISLYLIDSHAGETIDPIEASYDFHGKGEVDFRYDNEALILFLDGHVDGQSRFNTLDLLENQRDVKVRNLHQ